MRTLLKAFAATFIFSGGILFAQNEPIPEQDIAAPAAAPLAETSEAAPAEPAAPTVVIAADDIPAPMSRGRDTLSVDFPDEEVRNILRNVADLFELNLVIPDTLQVNTSIKLRDVTWCQIFEVVLGPVGYT